LKLDISQGDEDDETGQKEIVYQSLTTAALDIVGEAEEEVVEVHDTISNDVPSVKSSEIKVTSFWIVELTRSVVKWVGTADEKYKRLFKRRIDQLSQGLRSYALSKRLQGSDQPIYESKLDAGMRILWTPLRRDEDLETGSRRL